MISCRLVQVHRNNPATPLQHTPVCSIYLTYPPPQAFERAPTIPPPPRNQNWEKGGKEPGATQSDHGNPLLTAVSLIVPCPPPPPHQKACLGSISWKLQRLLYLENGYLQM